MSKHSTLYMTIFLVVAVAAGALIWISRCAVCYGATVEWFDDGNDLAERNSRRKTPIVMTPELQRLISPKTGEVWYDEAKPLERQGWFVTSDLWSNKSVTDYYEIGQRGDNKIVQAVFQTPIGGHNSLLFEVRGSTVVYIAQPLEPRDKEKDRSPWLDKLSSKVSVTDKDLHYDSLNVLVMTLQNGDQLQKPMNPSEPYDRYDTIIDESTNNANASLVQQLGEKSGVYRREGTSKDGSTTLISYFLSCRRRQSH